MDIPNKSPMCCVLIYAAAIGSYERLRFGLEIPRK